MTSIWALRLGTGALALTSLLATACHDAKKEAGGGPAASAGAAGGGHANEEFCKTLVAQFAALSKFDPSDVAKRPAYFTEQRELNAKLLKTAPASLQSDVQLQVRNANAAYDAQAANNAANIKATAAVMRSPEHLAAAKHMNEYCGLQATVSH